MDIVKKVIRWMKKENIDTTNMSLYRDGLMDNWVHVKQNDDEYTIIWEGHGRYTVIDINSL